MPNTVMDDARLMDGIEKGMFSNERIVDLYIEGRLTEKQLRDSLIKKGEARTKEVFDAIRELYKKMVANGEISIEQATELVGKGMLDKTDITASYKKYFKDKIEALKNKGDNFRYKANDKGTPSYPIYTSENWIQILAEIESHLGRKELTVSDLNNWVDEKVLVQSDLDWINDIPLPPQELEGEGFASWNAIPPLLPNRVDVFVLGLPRSGKSTFMSGLLYYANGSGNNENEPGGLDWDIENLTGYNYGQDMISAVENSLLLRPTPEENMQYMPVSFKNAQRNLVPLTFIEMGGEVFRKCLGKKQQEMPKKFVEYLNNENNKIFILVINYKVHTGNDEPPATSQRRHLDYIIRFLDQQGTLKNTEAICILLNKWDDSKDQSKEAAIKVLKENYRGIWELCEDMEKKYNLKFEPYPYSIGQFGRRKSYTYDPVGRKYSKQIYNWIASFSAIQKKKK